MGPSHSPLPRTIKKLELRQIVPLADSTIWEMEQRGEFPKRFRLTPRCVVWDLSEVQTWLEKRRRAPVMPAKAPDVRLRRSRPVHDGAEASRPYL